MHRQQSTGSTEKGCDSQNMYKRRTAVNIGCICLIFLFIFGFYKCIQWDNTSRREQEEAKEQKELDEKAADEKAYEQAKEYMGKLPDQPAKKDAGRRNRGSQSML